MPYKENKHWCLFILDGSKKLTWHLNPFQEEDSLRLNQCFEKLKNFLEDWQHIELNTFHTGEWRNGGCPSKNVHQTDTYNCGLYVLHYMDCIGRRIPFDENFDPLSYRKEVAESLLRRSENMKNTCLLCFSRKNTDKRRTCKTCQRFVHVGCAIKKKSICLISAFYAHNNNLSKFYRNLRKILHTVIRS